MKKIFLLIVYFLILGYTQQLYSHGRTATMRITATVVESKSYEVCIDNIPPQYSETLHNHVVTIPVSQSETSQQYHYYIYIKDILIKTNPSYNLEVDSIEDTEMYKITISYF